MSSILGTLIFVGILFTAVIPMYLVMNEADITDHVDGTPYVSLVKIPVFERDQDGLHPMAGSYEGVRWFYQEIEEA